MKTTRAKVVEICNRCGRNVAHGSGSFTNRVLDGNDILTRIKNYRPYPHGDFVCANCDSKTSNDEPQNFN